MDKRTYAHRHPNISGDFSRGLEQLRFHVTPEQIAIIESIDIDALGMMEIYMAGIVALKDVAANRRESWNASAAKREAEKAEIVATSRQVAERAQANQS
ncbi:MULTISPECIES: hypothetical protein [Rhodomicrobium]|uniref:hypothetical protein n=1 Tax=Rhodomicrobium TaxID=1068 RepID=UPI000F740725|nr:MULTISPECIES: hypothetical protein [Rhodomicrobium]